MKQFEKKTLRFKGRDVEVDAFQVDNPGGPPAIRAVAACGETTATLTLTLGPVDGAMTPPEPGAIQKRLDDLREAAARRAVHDAELAAQLAGSS